MVNITGGGKPQQQILNAEKIDEFLRKLGELSERTRLLEERLKQSREKLSVIDETFTTRFKELRGGFSSLKDEMDILRKSVDDSHELVRRIGKDIESTARSSDVRVLEKYINMIDFTRIVTKDDVVRIAQDEIKKSLAKKKSEV